MFRLTHVARVAPALLRQPVLARPAVVPLQRIVSRTFASESSFLPKQDVTDRIVAVIKGFDRVDAAKVSPTSHFVNDLGLDSDRKSVV